ncbi:11632_t:CDS:2 [Acaulospora morrowiae]|uniref:11632_t:CDS:1 n=1 Tax=Acaulospora morrowiae TaxID=94023 RepID=A0A9N8VB75_9GLOM|nr:11632_t:CDS:2 [Acaulospora morrowiae]
MSDKDLEYFEWNVENDEQDSNDKEDGGNNRYFEFEVKKSQEEQVDLSWPEDSSLQHNANENVKKQTKKNTIVSNEIDSSPSIHHSQHYHFTGIMTKYTLQALLPSYFKNDLDLKPKERSLKIDRTMSIKGLKFLVINGKRAYRSFGFCHRESKNFDNSKQELERKNIEKVAELVGKIIKKLLQKFHRIT